MRDLLDAPQLRMRLLHGDAAALNRPVARICATDMPDPRPFVTSGALVCTGLVWRHDPADSNRYIGMLAAAGVAGVVAGQALHGHVPDDVLTACERHGLPLLSAPQSVPFSRIIEHLAEQAAELRWRHIQSGADRQRRLLAAVAAGTSIADLIGDIAAEQDISIWLVTATGRIVAGTAPLSEEELDRIVTTALTAPRLPAVTTGALRIRQVGAGERITAWYLVIRPTTAELDSSGTDLAAIAEFYRQRAADRLHLDWELMDRFPAPPTDRPNEPVVAIVAEIHPATTQDQSGFVTATTNSTSARHTARPALRQRPESGDTAPDPGVIAPVPSSPGPGSGGLERETEMVPHDPGGRVRQVGTVTNDPGEPERARSCRDGDSGSASAPGKGAPDPESRGHQVRGAARDSSDSRQDSSAATHDPGKRARTAGRAAHDAGAPARAVTAHDSSAVVPAWGEVATDTGAVVFVQGEGAHGSGAGAGGESPGRGARRVARGSRGEVRTSEVGRGEARGWTGRVGLGAVRAVLHDVVVDARTSVDAEGRLVAIVGGAQDEIADIVRRRIGRLAPALGGIRLAMGVSARQRDESLSGAVAAAAAAASAAREDDGVVRLRVADIDSAVGLFTAVPGGLQRRFAERVLGPVVEYDRRTGAGLLETLEVFLGCEGSWRQAAERMHVHLNTVRYRIGRVEELTGRDLGRLDDRLDLYLAVRTLAGHGVSV
ncbi:helix-turn-helix domain-containing protein [Nocardia sp. IFM 10818]